MIKLKVFYHVTDLPGWEEITDEQLLAIKDSDLINNAEVHVNLHYNPDSFIDLKNKWAHPNIIWHHSTADYKECEHPTVIMMQEESLKDNELWAGLYLHQKGITHRPGVPFKRPNETSAWRRYLNYWNITRWRDCQQKLDEGYETVGTELQPSGVLEWKYYVGNIYWARSDYIRRNQPHLVLPSTVDYCPQHPKGPSNKYLDDCEYWVCKNKPKAWNWHNSGLNLYTTSIPISNYIKT
jgi:hypothetical protein